MRIRFLWVALWAPWSGEFRSVLWEMWIIKGTLLWTMYKLQSRLCRAKRKRWVVNNYCKYEQQVAKRERWTMNSWMCTTSCESWKVATMGSKWDVSWFCERQTANYELWILHWGRNKCLESSMEIIVERVSCKLRTVSCESWIGVEKGCLGSFVEPHWSLLKALWSTWGAFLEPRGGVWKHLGSVVGHLCEILGGQAGFVMIFCQFWQNFGSQNGSKNRSGEATKNDVDSGADFNWFLIDFGTEMIVFKITICVIVEYDVKCMSTFQYS